MKTVERLAARAPMVRIRVAQEGVGSFEAIIDDPSPPPPPPDIRPSLSLSLPKLSWNHRRGGYVQIWSYFQAVHEQQQSEAFVWLHWQTATADQPGEYIAVVPAFYCATAGGLSYPAAPERFCAVCQVAMFDAADFCPHCKDAGRPTPARFIGDWHSHGTMNEFHSGVDDGDEVGNTGIHLTTGRLHHGPTCVAHSFVVADGPTRFTTDWRTHFEYDETEFDRQRLALWLKLVASHDAPAGIRRRGTAEICFEGTIRQCALWIASRRDGAEFETVRGGTAPAATPTPTPTDGASRAATRRSMRVIEAPDDRPRRRRPAKADHADAVLLGLLGDLPRPTLWWFARYRLRQHLPDVPLDDLLGGLPAFDCDPMLIATGEDPDFDDWYGRYEECVSEVPHATVVAVLIESVADLLEDFDLVDTLKARIPERTDR